MTEEQKKTINLTTPLLVILLVIASFLAGSFWTRLKTGQSGSQPAVQQGEEVAQASPAPQQPEEVVLGEEDFAKIESGGAAVKGEKGAPITIVEFSEYECPYCKRYVDETYAKIWDEYGDQIYYVFHDYPLPFHAHAQKMAEVARCAGDQGKYWEMHDLLFKNHDEWAAITDVTDTVKNYADELGLDVSKFSSCLTSGKFTQAVNDDMALGQSAGVTGTPSFFINGQQLVGAQPFESFKAIIEAELNK